MKVIGIITEYNPFHNGHKYHIEEAKKITGADYVIAVMSGNFVQRGHPALMDKYARSLMALNNDVDLIFELPVCYATSSAEYFALGAVTLLERLKIVDYICFGSECGDVAILKKAAKLFNNQNENIQNLIYSYIREGLSYPVARAKATDIILEEGGTDFNDGILNVISEPNNILGIEYIKSLLQLNSSIKPITIKRKSAHYHNQNIGNATINSATAIRNIVEDYGIFSNQSSVKDSVPQNVYDYFTNNFKITYPITIKDFEGIIKYKLLSESSHDLSMYQDLSSDMADRIKNIDIINTNIHDLLQNIKTKNITLTRVNRALIHVLLNIKADDILKYTSDKTIYYGRILGMKMEATHLIRKIKNSGGLPIITKVSKANKQLDAIGMNMLNQDIFATHVYNQAVYKKYKTSIPNEYKHEIFML